VIMVPLVSGDLLIAEPRTSALARVRVAAGPLWRPTWNERTEQVAVAAGGGAVTSLDLRGWRKAPPPELPERGSGPSPRAAELDSGNLEAKSSRVGGGGA
jgi:hypothetical protein